MTLPSNKTNNAKSQEDKDLAAYAKSLPQSYRDSVSKEAIKKLLDEEAKANEKIKLKIIEAEQFDITNGMAPSVYQAIESDGSLHVGFNFQPVGTTVGHLFHYDHGAGISRNTDAMVVWIKK